MNDWRDATVFIILFSLIMLALILVSGCTATSAVQQEAEIAAIRGTFTRGVDCKRITVATGDAATAAARYQEAKQIELNR